MDRLGKTLERLAMPAIVILVGLACFGLGRLSVSPSETPRLVINQAPGQGSSPVSQVAAAALAPAPKEATTAAVGAPVGAGKYVASKSGSRYYLPTCSGVKRIKEENKVWFSTAADAEAAGYTKALNCPGL